MKSVRGLHILLEYPSDAFHGRLGIQKGQHELPQTPENET
jgi:hypothetical protein